MIHRAFRFRLYPTAEQEESLAQTVGAVRFVYNLALEQRQTFSRKGRSIGFVQQCRELTHLRAEVDWIRQCLCTSLHYALRDLDAAFQSFFRGGGYPRFRRIGENDSFRFKGVETEVIQTNQRWAYVRVPKLGLVKFRVSRPINGRVISATVRRQAGQWSISFTCGIEPQVLAPMAASVGIDRGVSNTIAMSTGELLSTTDLSHMERRKKRAQRILARRRRGSIRYRKQHGRLCRIAAKIARCRADWRHKATTTIANQFGTVVIEDLNTAGMTRAGKGKRGLNRSILAQGWGAFETVLAYKLQERGGSLVKVNPAYTSQECSACGAIDKASRESQSSYACRHCGFTGHADVNAAINIWRRGTALLPMEATGYGAVEVGTINHVAFAA